MTPSKQDYSSKNFIELGNRYYADHNYSEAIKFYEKSIQANRRVKLALLSKGIALREIGKASEAIICFSDSIDLDENYTDAYIEIAYTYYVLGDYIHANEYFKEALNIHPKLPAALNGLGLVAHDEGKYHDAILFYKKSIGNRRDPQLAYIYENIGYTYYEIGKTRYNDAEDSYNEAIRMNSNSVGAILGLGTILDEKGRKEESERKFAEAFNFDPNYVYLHWISTGVSLKKKVNATKQSSTSRNHVTKILALIHLP